METENVLAKSIDTADANAALDAACKKLLANKIILAWILKECVIEYRDYPVDDIAERYIEGEPQIAEAAVHRDERVPDNITGSNTEDATMTEGTITYDIRFGSIVPSTGEPIRLIINIEAQNDFYPGYPLIKRGIYYCSRMISSQYETYFTGAHYEQLRKVYSIWICINPPKIKQNTILRYSICEEQVIGEASENPANYDLLTAVMICLGSEQNEQYKGILKLLEVLLSSDRTPENKKKILSEDFEIKMTKILEGDVYNMCNISKGIVEKSVARGMAQGIAQGIEQGMAQGMEMKALEDIRNIMRNSQFTLEQTMALLGISQEEQVRYRTLLKQ